MDVPRFPYHPDPLSTGYVVASNAVCRACGQARGLIYTGPVYAVEELDDALCPWCIADGSAAGLYDARFTDDTGVPDGVPGEVVEQITRRTPGFLGWQQEHWLYHCDDGAAFVGPTGREDLDAFPDAIESLRDEFNEGGTRPPAQFDDYLSVLQREGDATAYLFRCRHCGRHLAYSDFR